MVKAHFLSLIRTTFTKAHYLHRVVVSHNLNVWFLWSHWQFAILLYTSVKHRHIHSHRHAHKDTLTVETNTLKSLFIVWTKKGKNTLNTPPFPVQAGNAENDKVGWVFIKDFVLSEHQCFWSYISMRSISIANTNVFNSHSCVDAGHH